MAKDKTKTAPKCPISRKQFTEKGPKFLKVGFSHDGDGGDAIAPMMAAARDFDSGSVGFYAGDKITLLIDGQPVRCQVSVNVTVVGSKELPN